MTLVVNGEEREVAAVSLAEALEVLDYAGSVVATALNGELRRSYKYALSAISVQHRLHKLLILQRNHAILPPCHRASTLSCPCEPKWSGSGS